ncbi:unnamed protein product [Pedinophyceae sp. YPF-701]|nr:unnamed protein product [Pedinophyceae sp. YPF-701]
MARQQLPPRDNIWNLLNYNAPPRAQLLPPVDQRDERLSRSSSLLDARALQPRGAALNPARPQLGAARDFLEPLISPHASGELPRYDRAGNARALAPVQPRRAFEPPDAVAGNSKAHLLAPPAGAGPSGSADAVIEGGLRVLASRLAAMEGRVSRAEAAERTQQAMEARLVQLERRAEGAEGAAQGAAWLATEEGRRLEGRVSEALSATARYRQEVQDMRAKQDALVRELEGSRATVARLEALLEDSAVRQQLEVRASKDGDVRRFARSEAAVQELWRALETARADAETHRAETARAITAMASRVGMSEQDVQRTREVGDEALQATAGQVGRLRGEVARVEGLAQRLRGEAGDATEALRVEVERVRAWVGRVETAVGHGLARVDARAASRVDDRVQALERVVGEALEEARAAKPAAAKEARERVEGLARAVMQDRDALLERARALEARVDAQGNAQREAAAQMQARLERGDADTLRVLAEFKSLHDATDAKTKRTLEDGLGRARAMARDLEEAYERRAQGLEEVLKMEIRARKEGESRGERAARALGKAIERAGARWEEKLEEATVDHMLEEAVIRTEVEELVGDEGAFAERARAAQTQLAAALAAAADRADVAAARTDAVIQRVEQLEGDVAEAVGRAEALTAAATAAATRARATGPATAAGVAATGAATLAGGEAWAAAQRRVWTEVQSLRSDLESLRGEMQHETSSLSTAVVDSQDLMLREMRVVEESCARLQDEAAREASRVSHELRRELLRTMADAASRESTERAALQARLDQDVYELRQDVDTIRSEARTMADRAARAGTDAAAEAQRRGADALAEMADAVDESHRALESALRSTEMEQARQRSAVRALQGDVRSVRATLSEALTDALGRQAEAMGTTDNVITESMRTLADELRQMCDSVDASMTEQVSYLERRLATVESRVPGAGRFHAAAAAAAGGDAVQGGGSAPDGYADSGYNDAPLTDSWMSPLGRQLDVVEENSGEGEDPGDSSRDLDYKGDVSITPQGGPWPHDTGESGTYADAGVYYGDDTGADEPADGDEGGVAFYDSSHVDPVAAHEWHSSMRDDSEAEAAEAEAARIAKEAREAEAAQARGDEEGVFPGDVSVGTADSSRRGMAVDAVLDATLNDVAATFEELSGHSADVAGASPPATGDGDAHGGNVDDEEDLVPPWERDSPPLLPETPREVAHDREMPTDHGAPDDGVEAGDAVQRAPSAEAERLRRLEMIGLLPPVSEGTREGAATSRAEQSSRVTEDAPDLVHAAAAGGDGSPAEAPGARGALTWAEDVAGEASGAEGAGLRQSLRDTQGTAYEDDFEDGFEGDDEEVRAEERAGEDRDAGAAAPPGGQ